MLLFLPEILSPHHTPHPGCFSAFLTPNPHVCLSVCLSIFVLDSLSACAVMSNQSQFSLFTVLIFYKVAMNMELANTDLLLLREKPKVRFLQASGHIFINRSIPNLILWVFLFQDPLFNIYC